MRAAILALAIFAVTGCATAAPSSGETDCYDLKVRAKPIGQFPTPIPHDPRYIVMSWPWFVDLEVTRVIDGQLQEQEISALAVLHSRYVAKNRTWLLRRNTLGAYNILRLSDPSWAKKCAQDRARPGPYLQPREGETLTNLRQAAVAKWEAEQEADERWLEKNGEDKE